MAAATKSIKPVTLKRTKDTKNTIRFDADENDLGAPITSLYVQKHAFAEVGVVPDSIVVTIAAG